MTNIVHYKKDIKHELWNQKKVRIDVRLADLFTNILRDLYCVASYTCYTSINCSNRMYIYKRCEDYSNITFRGDRGEMNCG